MMVMRVLVTGNEGYIGSILVPLLRGAGHEVVGLDVGLFRENALGPIAAPPTMRKDVRDIEVSDLEGIDAVIHLAGLANDPLGELDPPLTYEINHEGSVRLAEVVKSAGVPRLLYASTCSVYGAGGDDMITEDGKLTPLTAYAKSKVRAEEDIRPLVSKDFNVVFLRAATAYGVSPYLRFDLALNNLVAWAYATQKVYLKSDGQAWRPFVHVQDIAHAYKVLLEAPGEKVHGEIFNVGLTAENYRVRQLAEIVRDIVPDAEIDYAENALPDHRSYRVSCEKLENAGLGFAPTWTVEAGVREVLQAVRNWNVQTEQFEGPRYNRIAYLRTLLDAGRVDDRLRWVEPEPARAAHAG